MDAMGSWVMVYSSHALICSVAKICMRKISYFLSSGSGTPGCFLFSCMTFSNRRRRSGFCQLVGIMVVFVVPVPALQIVAKDIGHLFHLVYITVVVIGQTNDNGIFIEHAIKSGAVAMPPAIVVDQLLAIF